MVIVDKHAPATPDERHAGAQKVYFVIFTDPVENVPLDEIRRHLDAHKAWLFDVEKSGRVLVAGPLLDENYRTFGPGMIVLRASSFAEAQEIADRDPYHANGIRKYRIVPWQVNEGTLDVRLRLSDGSFEFD